MVGSKDIKVMSKDIEVGSRYIKLGDTDYTNCFFSFHRVDYVGLS